MLHPLLLCLAVLLVAGADSSDSNAEPRSCQTSGMHTAGGLRQALYAGASSSYDIHTRPSLAVALDSGNLTAPVDIIKGEFYVRNLVSVDPRAGTVEVYIREKWHWHDDRLRYTEFASGGCFEKDVVKYQGMPDVWKPDIYYVNELKAEHHTEYWSIYADGHVQWSVSSVKKLTCPFDFSEMPFDEQTCRTRVSLYRGNEESEILLFKNGPHGSVKYDAAHRIGGTQEWDLAAVDGEVFNHTAVGEDDTALDVVIRFKRDSEYYLLYVVCPTILIVLASYVSFFLSRAAVPARVGISMLAMLVVWNMSSSVRATLPASKGDECLLLDFMFGSSLFCLYAVMEYGACNYISRVEARLKRILKEVKEADKKERLSRGDATAEKSIELTVKPEFDSVFAAQEDGLDHHTVEAHVRKYACLGLRCIVRPNGTLRLRDEHFDIFSRYAFPVACAPLAYPLSPLCSARYARGFRTPTMPTLTLSLVLPLTSLIVS